MPSMITAVEYAGIIHDNDRYNGKIPVLLKDGSVELVRWGVYSHYEPDDLPRGSEVALGDIWAGKWKDRHRRPVQIPAARYRLSRLGYEEEWFNVPVGKVIQGVAMDYTDCGRRRPLVYVVTVTADPHAHLNFFRIPRLMRKRSA